MFDLSIHGGKFMSQTNHTLYTSEYIFKFRAMINNAWRKMFLSGICESTWASDPFYAEISSTFLTFSVAYKPYYKASIYYHA